ncbi:MAG TPA: hypothetical protein VGK89_09165 [Candidatus Eisenbacteria bacterium]
MSDPSASATARQWMARQLEELGGLYNAGVRSPVFKQWRQNTLTCMQRIWPGEPGKSERFRRIPFSPPMGRPAERDIREYFERGCGEAASLLKDYIAEIESTGVSAQSGAAPAGPLQLPSDEASFPTVDLSGAGAAAAPDGPRPPKAPMKIARPRLKDLLGFTRDLLGFAEVPPEPLATPDPSATAPAPPAIAPSAAHVPAGAPPPPPVAAFEVVAGPAAEKPGPPSMAKFELEEFLAAPEPGVLDLGPAPPAAASAPTPPRAAVRSKLVVTGSTPAGIPSAPQPPSVDATYGGETARGIPPLADRDLEIEPEDVALGRVAEELLRTSQLSLVPKSPPGVLEGMTREGRSPIALAVAALASEVDSFGVPEGSRARARATLLDLSRSLDDPNLTWETMQEAMSFLMQYPTLGRRVVPLLLPYLDRAA